MSTVVLESVSRRYGALLAVRDVSLTVREGEFVTLLGSSGCGKTTTLRMIAGLERNTDGTISIGDAVVSDAAKGWFVPPERRRLGMVFQSYAIWPHMTVFENVAYPLRIRRHAKSDVQAKVMAALKLVEMEAYAERPSPALSGGQQQRVAIARALVAEPSVLLLDEPLSNLDAKLRTQMGDEFRSLQRRLGITTLYVTHDQDEAMALSDRVVVMKGGRVLQVDTPEAIFHRPGSVSVARFLGAPNIVSGTVSACAAEGEDHRLDVAGEGWTASCLSQRPHQPGASVDVMIRPTSFRPGHPDDVASADLAVTGKVGDSVFRGASRTLELDIGGQVLTLELPSMSAPRAGETVSAFVPRGELWALERDEAVADDGLSA